MLPRLDRGHLLEEVLSSDEGDGRYEGYDGDADPIVAGVGVIVVHAVLLAVLVRAPTFSWYTAHYYDAE